MASATTNPCWRGTENEGLATDSMFATNNNVHACVRV